MMDAQTHIEQLLHFPAYQLSEEEKKVIVKSGVAEYLTRKILSNKYRKSAPSAEVLKSIAERVRKSVKDNSPIHLTIPTGGYKKWQLKSAPEVDWSEFFHLRFMLEYIAPLAAAYRPGVILDYFSNGWMAKVISFYSQGDIDNYARSFRALIDTFSRQLPANIKIRYHVVADQCDEKELLKRTLRNREKVEAGWLELSPEQKREKLKYSERSIRWDVVECERKLDQAVRKKLIYEGKIVHDCLLMGGWNSDLYYLRSENGIGIIHRNSDPYFLHLATVAGSFVQFWVGTGILEKRGDVFIPRVLSFDQYRKVQSQLKTVKISGIAGKNFSKIEVLDE